MSDLRTLKDSFIKPTHIVKIDDIRASAKEWIESDAVDFEDISYKDFGDDAWFIADCIRDWIKHFFNLEVEDG